MRSGAPATETRRTTCASTPAACVASSVSRGVPCCAPIRVSAINSLTSGRLAPSPRAAAHPGPVAASRPGQPRRLLISAANLPGAAAWGHPTRAASDRSGAVARRTGERGTAGSVDGGLLTGPRRLGIAARPGPGSALAVVPELFVDGPVRESEHEDHHQAHQRDQEQKGIPGRVAGLGEDLDRGHDRHNNKDELKGNRTPAGPGSGGQNLHARPPLRGCAPAPLRPDDDHPPCPASVDRTRGYCTIRFDANCAPAWAMLGT